MMKQDHVHALMKKYGIPTPELKLVKDIEDLRKMRFSYPVVMKVVSPNIVHKSDVGGVVMNIHSLAEAESIFLRLQRICDSKGYLFEGTMIQPQVEGHYLIVGLKRDPQFGPVVAFGTGGIFVEVMKDVVFRICPITFRDALEMIKETKGYPILAGARGGKFDINSIAHVIKKVSEIGENEDVDELDINPLIVWERGVSAVDVRVVKSQS